MQITLINGRFTGGDALNLITAICQEKIRFHERKIEQHSGEEDIKHREKRIREINDSLKEFRDAGKDSDLFDVEAVIYIKNKSK